MQMQFMVERPEGWKDARKAGRVQSRRDYVVLYLGLAATFALGVFIGSFF